MDAPRFRARAHRLPTAAIVRRKPSARRLAVAGVLGLLIASSLPAAGQTASVRGFVTDASNGEALEFMPGTGEYDVGCGQQAVVSLDVFQISEVDQAVRKGLSNVIEHGRGLAKLLAAHGKLVVAAGFLQMAKNTQQPLATLVVLEPAHPEQSDRSPLAGAGPEQVGCSRVSNVDRYRNHV